VQQEVIGDCTLYCGDALEVLPTLGAVDAIVTDPPYPDIDKGFQRTSIMCLNALPCRQFIFWSAVEPFPLSWSAIHIWHKPNGNSSQHYERIFERHGQRTCRVFRHAAILPEYVQYRHECVDHPTQKPLTLLRTLVARAATEGLPLLDCFMGAGTTGIACVEQGRSFIGIEIEPRYFDIACRRIEAAYAQPDLFVGAPYTPRQLTFGGA
jgi:DNA modification methylase